MFFITNTLQDTGECILWTDLQGVREAKRACVCFQEKSGRGGNSRAKWGSREEESELEREKTREKQREWGEEREKRELKLCCTAFLSRPIILTGRGRESSTLVP